MMQQDYNAQNENRAVFKLVLYILGVILVSALMLAVNTGLVFSLAQGIATLLPEMIGVPQFVQLIIFVGPVVLLYLEWYVWDVMVVRKVRRWQ
jgi:hypothetical protein